MKKLLCAALLMSAFAARAQTIPNGGMEDWRKYKISGMELTTPTGWISSDSATLLRTLSYYPLNPYNPCIKKEMSFVHSGAAAVNIKSTYQEHFLNAMQGYLSNASVSVTSPAVRHYTGATPVSDRIISVDAWLAYFPTTPGDKGGFYAAAIRSGIAAGGGDSIIGEGLINIAATHSYVRKTINIDYVDATSKPDHIFIAFSSTIKANTEVSDTGSTLYIDDVSITGPTGIETPLFTGETFKVFPNPAHDVLHIANTAGTLQLELYSLTGQLMQQHTINDNVSIDISSLPAGTYLYQAFMPGGNTPSFSGTFIRQ